MENIAIIYDRTHPDDKTEILIIAFINKMHYLISIPV